MSMTRALNGFQLSASFNTTPRFISSSCFREGRTQQRSSLVQVKKWEEIFESIVMELMDFLSDDEWQTAEPKTALQGFAEYRIIHRRSEGNGKFKYSAVHAMDEIPVEIFITGASPKRDPLKEIQIINLRINDQKTITGMNDNGDCVIRKK